MTDVKVEVAAEDSKTGNLTELDGSLLEGGL